MGDTFNSLLYFRLSYTMKSQLNYGPDQLGEAAVYMVLMEYNVSEARGQVQTISQLTAITFTFKYMFPVLLRRYYPQE